MTLPLERHRHFSAVYAAHAKTAQEAKPQAKADWLRLTASAPKSVSLALAESDERREELIRIHQIAVERVLTEIEKNHLRTRSNGKKLSARNMACGEFVHFLNRNNELDLHSHCVILNQTDTDGKILALDFDKLLEHQKMLGLIYRQELAHELLAAGYELEITNSREGYFELKGFDRETVMAHSTRRQEILAEASRQGAMTAQGKMLANLATRKAKDKSVRYEDVLAEVKQSLYDTGKIKIEYRRKEQDLNGKLGRRDDGRGGSFAGRGTGGGNADGHNGGNVQYEHLEAPAGQSGFADTFEDWSEMPQSLAQGLWMCQQDDLVCFCRATRYVIWQASRPKKNITLLCSGRIGRSADGE